MSADSRMIGPKNAIELTGMSWRWCCDQARRLHLPFERMGGRRFIRQDVFNAAMVRDVPVGESEIPLTEAFIYSLAADDEGSQ